MTNPVSSAATQPPHVPTLLWAGGAIVVALIVYHLIHKH